MAQRQRRLEMLERVGVREQRRRVLGGEDVLVGRRCIVAGQAQVLGDERRARAVRPPRRQRGRDAAVEQAAPRRAPVCS